MGIYDWSIITVNPGKKFICKRTIREILST